MRLRCKLGIHARYEAELTGPLRGGLSLRRELWCRLCPARWRITSFVIGGDMVRGVDRIEDRP